MDWTLTTPYLITVLAALALWAYFSFTSPISHPSQVIPTLRLLYDMKTFLVSTHSSPEWSWMFDKLKKTSPLLYFVGMTAPRPVLEPMTIFYLAARALDTIEDDTTREIEIRQKLLRNFYKNLSNPTFTLTGFGDKPHEIDILENYGTVATAFNKLPSSIQSTITRVIREMGCGMAEYLDKNVNTLQDLDEYCHYASGTVEIGIIQIGIDLGVQQEYVGISLAAREDFNNNEGAFQQKINIIRDFQEDIRMSPKPRVFWPREVWSKYTKRLVNFLLPGYHQEAVACANELICNAITHLPGVLSGMSYIDGKLFKFVSAPYVMALATYVLCYNNERMFQKKLRIKVGEAAYIFQNCDSFPGAMTLFKYYIERLKEKAELVGDENAKVMIGILNQGLKRV